jgi:hypothetical protein
MSVWVLPHCYVHEVQCVLGIVRYADHVGVIFGKQHHFESQAQSPNGDGDGESPERKDKRPWGGFNPSQSTFRDGQMIVVKVVLGSDKCPTERKRCFSPLAPVA